MRFGEGFECVGLKLSRAKYGTTKIFEGERDTSCGVRKSSRRRAVFADLDTLAECDFVGIFVHHVEGGVRADARSSGNARAVVSIQWPVAHDDGSIN